MFVPTKIRQKILSKISIKNFSLFFYKFGNIVSKTKINMIDTLSSNTKSGLKFAYKNFLESVYDQDLVYIEKNCEKRFAEIISNSIQKKELFIYESNTNINLSIVKIEFHFGAESNRNNNKLNGVFKVDSNLLSSMKAQFKLPDYVDEISNIYASKKMKFPPLFYSVARLYVEFHSNLILSNSLIKENKYEIHNVIFEIGSQNPFNLFSILNEEKTKEFNLFSNKNMNLEIIISDFDDFMKGNPLI